MDSGEAKAPHATQRTGAKPPPGLTAAALEKRLQLRKRAREDAARNLPRQDADDLAPAELAVIEAVAAERASIDQARNEAKAEAERRLRALAPTPQDFAGPALDARLAMKQVAGRLEHDWSAAARASAQTDTDLAAFKRAHRLHRAAVYPRSAILQAGLLFAAALFEALFSAALFAEDDARGLLGGAITAIGLSGANVTLGFLAGYFGLRYVQHVRLPLRILGAIGFAALALLALMLNLFAADWRDQMAALSGRQLDLGADASFHLWSLLQLDSPQAIILLMLGGGVWVFAAYKGYASFDDPYPDFGKMDRARRDAQEALSDFNAEGRAALEPPIETAKAALASRLQSMRAEFDAMNKAYDAAALQMQTLDTRARALDDAAATAIHAYRQENMAARATPAPAYFSAPPPSVGPALDALSGCAAMIDGARARLTEAHAQSTQAQEELVNELNALSRQLGATASA